MTTTSDDADQNATETETTTTETEECQTPKPEKKTNRGSPRSFLKGQFQALQSQIGEINAKLAAPIQSTSQEPDPQSSTATEETTLSSDQTQRPESEGDQLEAETAKAPAKGRANRRWI